MSVDLMIYLKRASMPSPQQWHDTILQSPHPMDLFTDFDPDTFTGFLPCKLNGKESGFEYYTSEMTLQDCEDTDAPEGIDFSITLVTGSDPKELYCSSIAACALAQLSGGTICDPQSGETIPAGAAHKWLKEQLDDL